MSSNEKGSLLRVIGLTLPLSYTENTLREKAAQELRIRATDIRSLALVKRSVDARKKGAICFKATVDVSVDRPTAVLAHCRSKAVSVVSPTVFSPVAPPFISDKCPVVVGSGPAGLFAALTLARAGWRPILLERGRDVDSRRADVERLCTLGILDPASNVQFGEGGAGTFSDGKLTTGIKDVRCRYVLEQLAVFGHCPDILWQAKPHVGTDRLRDAVRGIREEILRLGGEVRFLWHVTALHVRNGHLQGLTAVTPEGEQMLDCRQLILAIGHSARDTVDMLYRLGLPMQPKPFAVGVRIEHPRVMIDKSQYGAAAGHPALGAADYKLSCTPSGGRGVYTFCMCPGGVVMAAASEEGAVAVNGMSEYARDAQNSNSALLVGVSTADFGSEHPLAGIAFQRQIEQAAFRAGGGGYHAPAQMAGDFLAGRATTAFGDVRPSYRPGVTPSNLRACLPAFVTDSLRAALPLFGRQLVGFDRYDAVMTGVESRSSSPVRMLRDEHGQSAVAGVYPCGEGAGYAGGIMSAAVDGIRCAEWLMQSDR